MNIAGIQRTSTIDFPGCLACVLFVRGCDLDCFYCHNRALLDGGAPLLAPEAVWDFLKRRAGLLDGVVVSGGEPTLQKDLPAFLREARALGYRAKLDTNGQRPDVVRALLAEGLLDYVAVDVKALPEDYGHVAGEGASFAAALETLGCAMALGVPCEARTTVYPGMREDALRALARLLPEGLPCWRLNVYRLPEQYRPEDALRVRLPALTARELASLLPALRQACPGVCL